MKPIIINFPKSIHIDNYGRINISGIEDDNFINIDGLDYIASFIYDKENKPIRGGGNSFVLKLNSPYPDELGDDDLPAEAVIKICKNSLKSTSSYDLQRIARFDNETKALINLKDSSQNIIKILSFGKIKVEKHINTKVGSRIIVDEYLFYVIEYATDTLSSFLSQNIDLEIADKIDLCYSILNGLNELQIKGYYHRDIKADNILFVNGEWKISDLGLADNQNDDKKIDVQNEKIGPYGWLSPEVMNKVLTENKKHIVPPFDCIIDFKSDFFQIGKLFWFIFQGNLPIGNIKAEDFRINDNDLFQIILWLLQYNKENRPSKVDEVNGKLVAVQQKYINS
jgi:serine/threonine protein kinase